MYSDRLAISVAVQLYESAVTASTLFSCTTGALCLQIIPRIPSLCRIGTVRLLNEFVCSLAPLFPPSRIDLYSHFQITVSHLAGNSRSEPVPDKSQQFPRVRRVRRAGGAGWAVNYLLGHLSLARSWLPGELEGTGKRGHASFSLGFSVFYMTMLALWRCGCLPSTSLSEVIGRGPCHVVRQKAMLLQNKVCVLYIPTALWPGGVMVPSTPVGQRKRAFDSREMNASSLTFISLQKCVISVVESMRM